MLTKEYLFEDLLAIFNSNSHICEMKETLDFFIVKV
ncbi:MAG: hypothetical protein H6Q13_282 [Bacteroidetes bacterium]|jgi:hypothetical protein|nr:hypothetical protein [Bacteroidota bacterium]